MASSAQYPKPSVIHLRTLALMAANNSLSVIDALRNHQRADFMVFDPSKPTRYTFSLEGVPYATTLMPDAEGSLRFHISAFLGSIPFTAECFERRASILRVLQLCRGLPKVRFIQGPQQSLWMMSEPRPLANPTPDMVLFETLDFIQQIRPFVRVVRPYLEGMAEAA